MDEVWEKLEKAGGVLSAAQLAGLQAGITLGVELCVFSDEGGTIRLQV